MCEGCEERIHVGHQVHRIDRSISKLLEMRVKEEGLDEIALMHGWILRYLYEHQDKEIYQKDIEKYFGICRSAVTNIIQTLEKKGYICRASVANDARLKKVMLTEKGRENHEKLGEIFQKMDAQLEEGITEEELNIENMIYEIRGKQVMLDSDLAKLYQCKNGTKSINLAVNRNVKKFPNDFYFQLTNNETENLRFHFETSNSTTNYGGKRYNPYAFTEQGVAMLATVLHTPVAAEVSVNIMRAFVKMRKYISANLIEQDNMKNMLIKHDNEIKLLQESFSKLEEKEKINHIFYEGQIYYAYSLLIDIFNEAKKEIIIIDNYADKSILDMITNLNVKVIIVTRKFNLLKDIDIKKYNKQYQNLKVIYSDKFHDRFIILDKKVLYHSGASYKDLGNKCFAITKMEDKEYLKTIIKNIGEDKCTN